MPQIEAKQIAKETKLERHALEGGRLSDIQERLANGAQKLASYMNERRLFGSRLYTQTAPLQRDIDELHYMNEAGVFGRVIDDAMRLQSNLGQDVVLAKLPHELDSYLLNKLGQRGITKLLAIPAFPIETQDALEEVVAGGEKNQIKSVFPHPYLRGVVEGHLPAPSQKGYYMMVDTERVLARALEIDLHADSPVEIEDIVKRRGRDVIEEMGFDPDMLHIRPINLSEALVLHGMSKSPIGKIATRTRVNNRSEYVVADGTILSTQLDDQSKAPMVLALGFGKQPNDVYLSRRTMVAI